MLTKRAVDRQTYDPAGPSRQILYDEGGVPGFGVRVRSSGRKTFIVWYRNGFGRTRMLTLGQYGVLTVDQARKMAKAELARVATGADPVEERKAARHGTTVRDLADAYMERHAKHHKKTWREDRRRLDVYVLPALGTRQASDVRRADVTRLHSAIGQDKPYEANRVLALVSIMFKKAEAWGFVPEGSLNPARKVQTLPERSREQWVGESEMPALMAAIAAEESLYVRALFKLYVLTGLRRSELLGLRWTDLDLNARRLQLGETKSGHPHVLPLSELAVNILAGLPRMLRNPYVFPGSREGRPIANVKDPWQRIRARLWLAAHPQEAEELREAAETEVKEAKKRNKHASDRPAMVEARLLALAHERAGGPAGYRLHDLRRTTGSWLVTGGASLALIGKILNHKDASTTEVYARLVDEATRPAIEELGKKMEAAGMKAG